MANCGKSCRKTCEKVVENLQEKRWKNQFSSKEHSTLAENNRISTLDLNELLKKCEKELDNFKIKCTKSTIST